MGRMFFNVRMMGLSAALLLSAAFLAGTAIGQDTAQQPAMPAASATPAVAGQPGVEGLTTSAQQAPSMTQQAEERKKRTEQLLIALDTTFQHQSRLVPPGVKPEEVGNIVLTMWEHLLIEEWRNTDNINTRAPSPSETQSGAITAGIRELSLGGIVFKAKDDWTVWLNGQRLKPNALPKEVLDINVAKKYVELRWFDASTNLIYPVRLRPHQRFNIDSKMFLPGVSPDSP